MHERVGLVRVEVEVEVGVGVGVGVRVRVEVGVRTGVPAGLLARVEGLG